MRALFLLAVIINVLSAPTYANKSNSTILKVVSATVVSIVSPATVAKSSPEEVERFNHIQRITGDQAFDS